MIVIRVVSFNSIIKFEPEWIATILLFTHLAYFSDSNWLRAWTQGRRKYIAYF